MAAVQKRIYGGEQGTYLCFGETGQISAMPEYRRQHIQEEMYMAEYVTEGLGYIQRMGEDEIIPVRPGELCLVRPHVPVLVWADKHTPCSKMWFHVGGLLADTLWTMYMMPDLLVCPTDILSSFLELYHLLTRGEDTVENGSRLAVLLFDILTRSRAEQLFDREENRDNVPYQIRKYIDNHIYEDLTLDRLAMRFGYAQMHLIRLFRREFSITPMQYVLQRRMLTAKQLLAGTVMSVGEIASLLRYSSAQHFSATFRRQTGFSPSAYRTEKKQPTYDEKQDNRQE